MAGFGFVATVHDVSDVGPYRERLGIPRTLASCHSAAVSRYALEGHVPGDLVVKILGERPEMLGLAVPGMPTGSPGMEGRPVESYDVIAFSSSGRWVFAKR